MRQWLKVHIFTCSYVYELKAGLYLVVEEEYPADHLVGIVREYREKYRTQGVLYYYQIKNLRSVLSEVYRGDELKEVFDKTLEEIKR